MNTEEKLVALRAFIPPQLRNEFKSICVREGLTMNDVILDFVEDFVKNHDEAKTKNANGQKAIPKGLERDRPSD